MKSQSEKQSFVKGLVTGVLVLVVLGGVYMLGQQSGGGSTANGSNTNLAAQPTGAAPTQPRELPSADGSKIAAVSADDHVRGNPNAKVTMIEYSDFECPFCARFEPTAAQALAEYPNDVRLIYRHFPLRSIHPVAQKAAEASECAADQGKFWEMHDEMFELNRSQNLSLATIKTAAGDIGLNTTTFNNCLDSGEKAPDVEADYQDGLAGGVSGTPGTFVNGQYLAGALPFESLKALIDSNL